MKSLHQQLLLQLLRGPRPQGLPERFLVLDVALPFRKCGQVAELLLGRAASGLPFGQGGHEVKGESVQLQQLQAGETAFALLGRKHLLHEGDLVLKDFEA
jgi:hypothetical protein